ncbi:MAG: hypothetical protein AB1894_04925 [Chloroflexota bacterium]
METQATWTKGRLTVGVLVILSLVMMSGFCLCNAITVAPSKNSVASLFNLPPEIRLFWGVVAGLIAVALLWLGAGIAAGLARLPNFGLRLLVASCLFAGAPLALIVLFAGPFLLMWLRSFSVTPDWKALKPAPERVIEIVDADIDNVYVRTDAGKILQCATAAQEECWQEVGAPVTIMERTRRIPLPPSVHPPGNAVSTFGVACDTTAETGVEAYYALLADGSVVWLRHESGHPYVILFGWLMPLLITLGILVGFAPVYLGAAVIGLNRSRESAPLA